jgi:hypothetical protein
MFTDKVLLTICVNCVVFVFTNKSRPRELCKLLISYLKLNQRFPVFGSNRLYLFMTNDGYCFVLVMTILSFPNSWLVTGFVKRVTQQGASR